MSTSFLAFVAVSTVVIVTPGPDTALTIRNTLAGGRPAGLATAFGVAMGQLVWAAATSLGVVAVLLASEPVFHALRLAGAAYLLYLGVQSLREAFAPSAAPAEPSPRAPRRVLAPRMAFGQGIVNDLANPKMAVFFASVLPQFALPGQGMLSHLILLGAVFAGLTCAWLAIYAALVASAGARLRRSRLRRWLDGIAGAALVAFGLRVAANAEH